MDTRHAHLAERIRAGGFRATGSRLTVLSFLEKMKYPLSIQRIAKSVGKKVDQVTVYRIVEAFAKSRIIFQSDLGEGRVYEYAPREHHHLVCTKCRKVADIGCHDFSRIARSALKQTRGFAEVKSHSLELFGVCTACAAKA
jgi:Fe2+ or Zn2+ uptake regulation protein